MKNLHYHPLHIVGISYYTTTLMLLVTKGYKQSCVVKKVSASTIAKRLKKLLRKINPHPAHLHIQGSAPQTGARSFLASTTA